MHNRGSYLLISFYAVVPIVVSCTVQYLLVSAFYVCVVCVVVNYFDNRRLPSSSSFFERWTTHHFFIHTGVKRYYVYLNNLTKKIFIGFFYFECLKHYCIVCNATYWWSGLSTLLAALLIWAGKEKIQKAQTRN